MPNPLPLLDFPSLLRAVRRRAAVVVAIVAVAIGAASAWVARAPKQWRATATMLIERPLPTELGIASPMSGALEQNRFVSTQCQVLRSRTVLEALSQRFDFLAAPEFAGLDREQSFESLTAGLEVEPRGDSALVDVGFTALDPQRAADLVNGLCDAYLAHVATREKEHVRGDLAAIEAELPRLSLERENGRFELEDFKEQNAFLTFDGREELLAEELKQQSRIAQESRSEHDRLEARRRSIEQAGPEADPVALARALELAPPEGILTKLVEAEARRAELAGTQGTRTAQIEMVDAEIARLGQRLVDDARSAISALVTRCGIAQQTMTQAQSRLDDLQSTAAELDRAKARYQTLAARVTDATELYGRLNQRHDELLVLEARSGTANRIFVQDPAVPPAQPCAPRPVAVIAVATLLGLLLGAASALLLARIDDRVDVIEDLEASLETTSIARIPHLPVHSGVNPEIEWMRRPHSFPADEFRKLFLTLGGDQGTTDRARVITVLSAVPREGKTLVATGLAMAAARAGYSTLLVDGDLKRPRIHEVFSLDGAIGVLDHLAGRTEIHQVVHVTRHDNLSVLPAGTPTQDLERLAQPRRLAALVEQLRKGWQVVIIDTSPTLLSADAFVFARHADERILVASAASSRVGPLRQAMAQLRHLGIEVRGPVVNRFATPVAPYGAYEYVAKPSDRPHSRKTAPETVAARET